MFRCLFVLLLIANLLVCPLRCFSCQSAAAVESDTSGSVCSCCRESRDGSTNREDVPSEDCSCPNCLCEGATLQDDTRIRAMDVAVSFERWTHAGSDHQLREQSLLWLVGRDRPPCFPGGDHVLVACQCWLI